MRIQSWVQEADAAFADGETRLVDEREDCAGGGRGGGGAVDEGEVAVECYDFGGVSFWVCVGRVMEREGGRGCLLGLEILLA